MRQPPHLAQHFPEPAPVPVPGCTECGRLAAIRREAAAMLDRSAVTDANVMLRAHQATAHR